MPTYLPRIYINGKQYQTICAARRFSHSRDYGCAEAQLTFPSAPFDDFLNIDEGDRVEIRYGAAASTRWWMGVVSDLHTSLEGGLEVQCNGMYVYLDEVTPTGRFGQCVETLLPTNVAAETNTSGGALAAGTWQYYVTSLDDQGETLPSSLAEQITTGNTSVNSLAWDEMQGATGYKVYAKLSTDSEYETFVVSETTFDHTGNTTGETASAVPVANTAIEPTIESATISDIVDYLLDEFLPDELTKGTIDIDGDYDIDVDDVDFSTDAHVTLRSALQTLADLAGNIAFGVDKDGEVYFKSIPEPEDATIASKHKFVVGKSGGALVGSVVGASRSRTRDGVSLIKIEGEKKLADDGTAWGEIERGDFNTVAGDYRPAGIEQYFLRAQLFLFGMVSIRDAQQIDEWNNAVQSIPYIAPETTAFFSGNTEEQLQPYFLVFPGLWKLYRVYQSVDALFVAAALHIINGRLKRLKRLRGDSGEEDFDGATNGGVRIPSSARADMMIAHAPGITNVTDASRVALEKTRRYPPSPTQFDIRIANITELIEPGLDVIQFTTQKGTKYKLPVIKAEYEFNDVPTVSLNTGDDRYTKEKQEKDDRKTLERVSLREHTATIWRPANTSILGS